MGGKTLQNLLSTAVVLELYGLKGSKLLHVKEYPSNLFMFYNFYSGDLTLDLTTQSMIKSSLCRENPTYICTYSVKWYLIIQQCFLFSICSLCHRPYNNICGFSTDEYWPTSTSVPCALYSWYDVSDWLKKEGGEETLEWCTSGQNHSACSLDIEGCLKNNKPLKRQRKIHLKIPPAFVVCCKFLLTLFNKVKYRDKQCGPRSDCSYRSSLIWVYTVCWKGF